MNKPNWIALLASVVSLSSLHASQLSPLAHTKKQFARTERLSDEQTLSPLTKEFPASTLPSAGSGIPLDEDAEVFITYEPDEIKVSDASSVRQRWVMLCAEWIAQNRLAEMVKDSFSYYDVYTEGKHFAPSFLSIQLSCKSTEEQGIIEYLEEQVSKVRLLPINSSELTTYRNSLLEYIADLLKEDKKEEEAFVYSCLTSEYMEEAPALSFEEFLHFSYEALSVMTIEEVAEAMFLYFEPENRILETITQEDLFEETTSAPLKNFGPAEVETSLGIFNEAGKECTSGFSSLKRGLSDQASDMDLYNQLRLTETDKKLIRKIVTTMADKNVFQLLLDKKTLEKKGKQVRPIHPLKFLGYICADGHLRKCLNTISKNHFKWSSFVDGFKDRMKEEAKKGQLLPYVPGFSQLLGQDPNIIAGYINRGDYEGLIKHLI